jgi:cystathionine beta-lyase/cystathionine gamma-synthase
LTETFWAQWGVVTHLVDVTDLHAIDQALRSWHPKAMLLETLSNPLLKVPDIPEIVRLSQGFDCRVIVDNTFATPYLFRPIAHGADVVVHSATKYLGGHGDAMGGIVVVRERAAAEALHQFVKLRGAVLGPFEAWLLHRGIKTLAVRIRQQCDNAHHVAQALAQSGAFERVVYPGLPDHPSHQMAKRLFGDRGAGAVVTVDMAGGRAAVFRFLKRLTWVTSATTVGDVYTLCLYPKISSHRNQSPALLDEMGIHDGTVRIAVGLESWRDIVNDVLQAVKA